MGLAPVEVGGCFPYCNRQILFNAAPGVAVALVQGGKASAR